MAFKIKKRWVFCFLWTIAQIQGYSQNNLSFGQTLLITSGTVPAGKTWKLEGIVYSDAPQNLSTGAINNIATYKINGVSFPARKTSSYHNSTSAGNGVSQSSMVYNWEMTFPLWFPAGTFLEAGSSVAYFSILE